jgi:predicted ATPase
MTYQERSAAARDGAFQDRVTIGAVKLSNFISGSEDAGTSNHANRIAFASQVLASPRQYAERLALGVITASVADTIETTDDLTDEQVQSALETIWNAYAGSGA